MCLHALRGLSRHWTAQPAGSYRFLDHGRKSQWSPTVHGPPITPGTPLSRCDRTEPPQLSVCPSQPALARPRLPACDGRGCLAHAALVQMLCAALTIPSVYAAVNQRSTDLSVRRGLAGLSVSALQGAPCPISSLTTLGPMCCRFPLAVVNRSINYTFYYGNTISLALYPTSGYTVL